MDLDVEKSGTFRELEFGAAWFKLRELLGRVRVKHYDAILVCLCVNLQDYAKTTQPISFFMEGWNINQGWTHLILVQITIIFFNIMRKGFFFRHFLDFSENNLWIRHVQGTDIYEDEQFDAD